MPIAKQVVDSNVCFVWQRVVRVTEQVILSEHRVKMLAAVASATGVLKVPKAYDDPEPVAFVLRMSLGGKAPPQVPWIR